MPLELELDQVFTKELTVPLIYGRGDREISIDAIPAESVFEIESSSGTIIEYRTTDFIVQQTDIDFGQGPVPPNRKDRVTLVRNGTSHVFEVLPEPSLQHFRETDSYGFCYRIHTKEKPN